MLTLRHGRHATSPPDDTQCQTRTGNRLITTHSLCGPDAENLLKTTRKAASSPCRYSGLARDQRRHNVRHLLCQVLLTVSIGMLAVGRDKPTGIALKPPQRERVEKPPTNVRGSGRERIADTVRPGPSREDTP